MGWFKEFMMVEPKLQDDIVEQFMRTKMKRHFFTMITGLLCCIAWLSSCSDEDEGNKMWVATPGRYTIEMNLDTWSTRSSTRGVDDVRQDFDQNYSYDYIYLHDITTGKAIKLPVYEHKCDEKIDSCVGFRYHITIDESGNAIIIPLDKDNNEVSDMSLSVGKDDQCYFSSWEKDEWELSDDKITEKDDNFFYQRDSNANQEIFRSTENYGIDKLSTSSDVELKRNVAAFSVVFIISDATNYEKVNDNIDYYLKPKDFQGYIGDDPSNWYVKIYIGGNCMTNKYNLGTQKSIGDKEGGYYSSVDIDDAEKKSKYLPFEQQKFLRGRTTYHGLGYYTRVGNSLLTPVKDSTTINVYILIKHWEKEGTPDEKWLTSDEGALMTKVDLVGDSQVKNNVYFTFGLEIDIEDFRNAWKNTPDSDVVTLFPTSRSIIRGVRELKLKKAISFVEVH